MKLELKHLSPYLPYDLKVMVEEYGIETMTGIPNHVEINTDVDECNFIALKPILRPLSDFEKFDDIIFEMTNFEITTVEENREFMTRVVNYQAIEMMFKNHIDVFGLIEKGLAIDIKNIINE